MLKELFTKPNSFRQSTVEFGFVGRSMRDTPHVGVACVLSLDEKRWSCPTMPLDAYEQESGRSFNVSSAMKWHFHL